MGTHERTRRQPKQEARVSGAVAAGAGARGVNGCRPFPPPRRTCDEEADGGEEAARDERGARGGAGVEVRHLRAQVVAVGAGGPKWRRTPFVQSALYDHALLSWHGGVWWRLVAVRDGFSNRPPPVEACSLTCEMTPATLSWSWADSTSTCPPLYDVPHSTGRDASHSASLSVLCAHLHTRSSSSSSSSAP